MKHRFLYKELSSAKSTTLQLTKDVSHHIKDVLRLRLGDIVELFNGDGYVAMAKIVSKEPQVIVEIFDTYTVDDSSRISLYVGQSVLKGKKMDLVVQKCTELGVSAFTPVVSSRSQIGMQQMAKKDQRWRRIIESATSQCRRTQLMELNKMVDMKQFLAMSQNSQNTLKLIFWEKEKEHRFSELPALESYNSVSILLGPEGGFSKEDVQSAHDYGFCSMSLGNHILRAETATIAAVAILQNLLGTI